MINLSFTALRADLRDGHGLLELAQEFGKSTGRGAALRSALDKKPEKDAPPRPAPTEPHERGAQFVAAVFDAFLQTYQAQIADLLRIATGGMGELPKGSLPPDLVNRVTEEAVRNADRVLGMVVRAVDYLPVVDPTFGDVVRAIVTADRVLYPDDEMHLRARLVEALRRRGIYPLRVSSLADEALSWPKRDDLDESLTLNNPADGIDLAGMILASTRDLDPVSLAGAVLADPDDDPGTSSMPSSLPPTGENKALAIALKRWADTNAYALGLDPDPQVPTELVGVHVAYRQAADGQPRPEVVIQFAQHNRVLDDKTPGLSCRAGTTVIARVDGHVNFVVSKPLPLTSPEEAATTAPPLRELVEQNHRLGQDRLAAMTAWTEECSSRDPHSLWSDTPSVQRLTFAHLHAGVIGADS